MICPPTTTSSTATLTIATMPISLKIVVKGPAHGTKVPRQRLLSAVTLIPPISALPSSAAPVEEAAIAIQMTIDAAVQKRIKVLAKKSASEGPPPSLATHFVQNSIAPAGPTNTLEQTTSNRTAMAASIWTNG